MKVAIVGLSSSTHSQAPFGDADWEMWGLPWDIESRYMFDRHFEMHDRNLLELPEALRATDYWTELARFPKVYMQQHYADIPGSIEYPLDALKETVFKGFSRWDQDDWYNSSPAYMIALAIHEGATTIGLWGIDVLDDSEFAYESPCLEYLIGIARGRGIEVIIPEGPTHLNKFRGTGIKLGTLEPVYNKRYGYV